MLLLFLLAECKVTLRVWRIGDGSAEREMGGQAGTSEVQKHRAEGGWLADFVADSRKKVGRYFSSFLSCLLFSFSWFIFFFLSSKRVLWGGESDILGGGGTFEDGRDTVVKSDVVK